MAPFPKNNPETNKPWRLKELRQQCELLTLSRDSLSLQDYGKIFNMVTTDLSRRAALHTKEISDLARDWKTQYSPWLAENLQPVLVSSKSRFDSVRKNIKPNLFLNWNRPSSAVRWGYFTCPLSTVLWEWINICLVVLLCQAQNTTKRQIPM